MTADQKEIVWNALHDGKVAAMQAYGLTKHLEGAREHYDAIDKRINAAMDLVNKS